MDGQCRIVQNPYQNTWIPTTPGVAFLLEAISAVFIVCLAAFCIRCMQMYRNSQYLLQVLNSLAVLGCIGCTVLSIYRIMKYMSYQAYFNSLEYYQVCFLTRLPTSMSYMIMNMTILAMVAKNFFFILRSREWKRELRKYAEYVFVLFVQWLATIIVMAIHWYEQVSKYVLPICRREMQKSDYMHYLVIGMIFSDIFSAVVFFVLLFYNRKLKKGCTGGVSFSVIVPHELLGNVRILKFLLRSAYVPPFMLIAEVIMFILHEVISFYEFYEITLILKMFHQPAIYAIVTVMMIAYGYEELNCSIVFSKLCNIKKCIKRLFPGVIKVESADDFQRQYNGVIVKLHIIVKL